MLVISNRPRASRSSDFEITRSISNGNRTEWSPIRSVIIRVIQNRTTAQRESDLFITSMITD